MTIVFVQARMGSNRLPGKVLQMVAGRAVLMRIVDRMRAARTVDEVVVLTSTAPQDDAIVNLCNEHGVEVMRGSEHDVLDRYATAAAAYRPDVVVRVTGDCPLIDPGVVDEVIGLLRARPELVFASVASGALSADAGFRRYPDGLDAEAMRASVLAIAAAEASDPFDREHVTPFIWKRPERFPAAVLEPEDDMGEERWTLDYASDLALIRAIYERLDRPGDPFDYHEVMALLDREPDLRLLNQHNRRED